jgi:hypothetical protein
MSSLFTTWVQGTGIELMLIGAIWLGWNLATRNIRDFFDLRLRIRRSIERMGDPEARMRPPKVAGAARAAEPAPAAEGIRVLGYELLGFAHRAPLSARLVKLLGYDAIKAGDQLVSLARDGHLVFRCRLVARALRFREDAPDAG